MAQIQPSRTTRQPAVARFRQERLARRADDLEDRLSTLLAVAERVLEIATETQTFLQDTESNRAKWGAELKDQLAQNCKELKADTVAFLADRLTERNRSATEDRADRNKFVEGLREEVVRIVSSDFAGR